MSKLQHDVSVRAVKAVNPVLITLPFAGAWFAYYASRLAKSCADGFRLADNAFETTEDDLQYRVLFLGALDSGIRGDHSTLIAKAALDGVTAVIFASSLGIGVLLSAVPVFVRRPLLCMFPNQKSVTGKIFYRTNHIGIDLNEKTVYSIVII